MKYQSYRKYLEDCFLSEKASQRNVSLATFARGFDLGASTFKMILTGDRNLTVANIHAVAKAMKMSPVEHQYFEALVLHEQANEVYVKSYYKRRLKQIVTDAPVSTLRTSERVLLQSALIPTLLIYLLDFEKVGKGRTIDDLDIQQIAAKFKMPELAMRALLEKLNKAGVLVFDQNEHVHIVYEKVAGNMLEQNYFMEELKELVKAVPGHFKDRNSFFRAFTLTIKASDLPALKADLIAVMENYMQDAASENGERMIEKVVVGAFPALKA